MYNGKLQCIVKTYQLTFKNHFGVFQPKYINVFSNYGFIFRLSMNDNGSYELCACRVQYCNIFVFTKYRNILRKVNICSKPVKNVDIEISTQDGFLENVFISLNICS